jgi:hypothetical protein
LPNTFSQWPKGSLLVTMRLARATPELIRSRPLPGCRG